MNGPCPYKLLSGTRLPCSKQPEKMGCDEGKEADQFTVLLSFGYKFLLVLIPWNAAIFHFNIHPYLRSQ